MTPTLKRFKWRDFALTVLCVGLALAVTGIGAPLAEGQVDFTHLTGEARIVAQGESHRAPPAPPYATATSIEATPSDVMVGHTFQVTGAAVPTSTQVTAKPTGQVTIYRLTPGEQPTGLPVWKNINTADGSFGATDTATAAGTYTYWAIYSGYGDFLGSQSAKITVTAVSESGSNSGSGSGSGDNSGSGSSSGDNSGSGSGSGDNSGSGSGSFGESIQNAAASIAADPVSGVGTAFDSMWTWLIAIAIIILLALIIVVLLVTRRRPPDRGYVPEYEREYHPGRPR